MRRRAFAESRLILHLGQQPDHLEPALLDARAGGQARAAPSCRASIRTAARRRRSATSTSRCCPAPTRALALGLMHVLIARRPARPRLHRAPHASASTRCARAPRVPAGARGRDLRHRRDEIVRLARDYGTTRPAAIRLNYGMQRRAAAAMRCAPSPACRRSSAPGAIAAGGLLLSTSGTFPGQPARRWSGRPARAAAAAHHQHDRTIGDALRRTRDGSAGATRSSSTTPTRSRSRPIRRRCARASRATISSRSCSSTSRPTPPTTPTSCCRRRRSSSTSTSTLATATCTCW